MPTSKLCQEIATRITRRTDRRVHGLAVEVGERTVTLHGRTTTFHVKQLAQQEVLEEFPDLRLVNSIVVEK
jgi:hypothetical protein